jgi:nucleoside-triphosphatase THEP1
MDLYFVLCTFYFVLDTRLSHTFFQTMIFLLTGESGSGKTTLMKALATILGKNNLTPGGFTAPGTWHNGKRSGFMLHDLYHKKEYLLAETGSTGLEMQGPFVFNTKTLESGNQLLSQQLNDPQIDLIFLDEVGPFELRNKGWADSLELLARADKPQIWTVRPQIVELVSERWGFKPAFVFSALTDSPEQIFRKITELYAFPKR